MPRKGSLGMTSTCRSAGGLSVLLPTGVSRADFVSAAKLLSSPVLPLPSEPICFRNKYLLLNNQELNELSAISLKANIPEVEAVLNTDR